jgi:UDP-glucose:(heptosyl)LPS alpha-1,3-glucosyltransferase
MQIALCHENVLPRRGGAEMYVADFARRLAAAGHDVHLYASQWDHAALPKQLEYRSIPKSSGGRAARPWQFSETLGKTLRTSRPQISIGFDKVLGTDVYYPLGGLHAASAAHNLLKHRAGLPRTLARIAQSLDRAQRSYARIEQQIMSGPDRPLLVANSNLVRQHAVQYHGAVASAIPVIHNAIDPHRFAEHDRPAVRAAMREQWAIDDADVAGAIIAMNYRLKGLKPLLRSLALLPSDSPFRLLVVGSPKTKPWEKLARRLGVENRVRFVGHCGDVRQVFFASDLLVHPTFYDPCSLVVLEALACGLPVITTRNNGASELLPAEAGSVVADPHDLPVLADTITQWTAADRRRLGSYAARAAASNWTFDHHVSAFEQVLAGVIERRLKAAG